MKQLLARFRYFVATLLFLLTTAMSSGGAAFALDGQGPPPPATSPLYYSGQGYPISQQCSADSDTPAGTMLFIFAYGGNYDPTNVTLHGITVLSQTENGNEMHIFTTYSDNLTALENNVNVTWDGSVGNAQLVISHGCAGATEDKTATPAAPTKSEPTCENPNMLVTPTASEGVVWSPAGATTLAPGQSVTYRASAADGYVLAANATTEFTITNNFDVSTCQTLATPLAPSATTPSCEMPNVVVTINASEGVNWTPAVSTTLTPGQSVTYTATAAANYYFAAGQKTDFTFTNDFNPATCGCGCETNNVTAEVPQFKDVCGYENDTYTIPITEHVKYYVNGSVVATTAGTYHVTSGQTITVTAVADANYHLTNGPTWTFTFTDKDCKPCVKKVRVPLIKIHDVCGTKDDTFTVPGKTGVIYKINGQVLGAGTYKASDYTVNGDITVEAIAMPGYQLKGTVHGWTYHFTNEPCGGGGGEQNTPVTPAAVTFNEVCETANDTYTIPATPGVTYKVNGVVTAAGTYHGTGTVNVTAEANVGYVLNGTSVWTHTFTNEACAGSGGQVLGESTVVFTPTPGKGAVAAAELANTGQNSLASAIVAFVIATSSVLVYAFSPRRQLGNN